jgi:hypothetical protein
VTGTTLIADVLVFNTSGPEAIEFKKITNKICIKYFNQLLRMILTI